MRETLNQSTERRTPRVWPWFFLLLSLLLLAATAAGYAGRFRYLELLSDYRPYLLGAGLAALASILAVRPRKISRALRASCWGIALATAVNGFEVVPWILSRPPTAPKSSRTNVLSAIAFNVENNNQRFDDVVRFIQAESPDIAVCSESVGEWPARLAALKTIFPHHLRLENLTIDVFSKLPLTDGGHHAYGPSRGFRQLTVTTPDGPVLVIAAHACPRHWYGEEGFQQRSAMLTEGLGKRLDLRPAPLLVLGDLNASPWSPDYKAMIHSSGLRDARYGRGILQTRRGHGAMAKLFWQPIDHVLHNDQIVIRSLTTGPFLGSDHLPVLARFSTTPSP